MKSNVGGKRGLVINRVFDGETTINGQGIHLTMMSDKDRRTDEPIQPLNRSALASGSIVRKINETKCRESRGRDRTFWSRSDQIRRCAIPETFRLIAEQR